MTALGKKNTGYGKHELDKDYVIHSQLHGYITGEIARSLIADTKRYVDTLHNEGKPACLVIDISGVTGQSSDARSAAKGIGDSGLDKIAIVGGNRALTMIGQYVVRAGGMSGYTKFFRTLPRALDWIHGRNKPKDVTHNVTRIVLGFVVALTAVAALVGWALDVPALKAVVPSLKPMNPMTAITLLVASVAVVLFSKNAMTRGRTLIVGLLAGWVTFFGVLILARYILGIDIQIDTILYGSDLATSTNGARTALSSGINFTLLGVMMFFALTGQRSRWSQYGFHIFSIILLGMTLYVLARYAFGVDRLYATFNYYPMALNTVFAFLLLNYAMQYAARPLKFFERLMDKFVMYGQAITVVGVVVIVTGIAWQQSKMDLRRSTQNSTDTTFSVMEGAVKQRMDTYINALGGFKAFFQSSSFVDANEYAGYFIGSDLARDYPGFTAISFARSVPLADRQTFIKELKEQSNLVPQYASTEIRPSTGAEIAYPTTYVEPHTATTSFGFDLGSEPTRRAAIESARDTGSAAATGLINLNASRGAGAPFRPGFFITMPIYKFGNGLSEPQAVEDRRSSVYGFVNSVFEYQMLFDDIFSSIKQPDVRLVIRHADTDEVLYTYNAADTSNIEPRVRAEGSTVVAGQKLKLTMYTAGAFGASRVEWMLPTAIFIAGVILSSLAAALMLSQARRREQAIALAAQMTEDLNNERNTAISLQKKDEAILSSIGDAVFAIDSNRRITLFNPAAETISGFTAAEALSKPYKEVLKFIFEKDSKDNEDFVVKAFAGHLASMKNHTMLIRKDGDRVAVADSAAPIRDQKGVIVGVIVVFRDVSKERALEQAKTEFVSLASHQLRTPLSAINWYSEMLLNGDAGKLTDEQSEYLHQIQGGNHRMIDLVNSLLDASRLDLGKLANSPEPIDMNDLAASLEKEIQGDLAIKNQTFAKDVQPNLSTVAADPKLVRMIMQNLLSNAVKYTPEKGSITLTMRSATNQDLEKAHIRSEKEYFFMAVTDTGYGIPKAQQPKIFEKMFRADNVVKMTIEGTGLGLYIVREAAKIMGGAVWFESIEGAGTTFYVVLPYHTKAVAARARMESEK